MKTRTRVLLVGLGGTGGQCVLEAKQLFLNNFGAVPPYIKLLCLDTVPARSQNGTSIDALESVLLTLRDPSELLANPESAHLREWFPADISPRTAIHGAAQIRPLGRLALHSQPERVIRQLNDCLSDLTDVHRLRELMEGETVDEQGSIEIYIFASLCGGTGSGIIIDTAWLLQDLLRNAPSVNFYGILLLPGPFKKLPGTGMVRSNAYAALKELDYLASPRDPVSLTFGAGRSSEIRTSPFDLIYLVDNISERYDTTSNLNELARQMAYLPYLLSTGAMGPYVREVLRNLIPQLESKPLVHGKRATYASFGLATLEVPRSAIQVAATSFQKTLVMGLLADASAVESLDDLGIPNTLAKCRIGHIPENLHMFLGDNFDHPATPINRLEQTFADATQLIDHYAHKAVEAHLTSLRTNGTQALQKFLSEATNHPSRLPSALRECDRLGKYFDEVKGATRAPITGADFADRQYTETWEACKQAYQSRRSRRRRRAALEWQNAVNQSLLRVRVARAINELVGDSLGVLADEINGVRKTISGAVQKLQNIVQALEDQKTTASPQRGPFTRNIDPPKVDANPTIFLNSIVRPELWFAKAEAEMARDIREFSQKQVEPKFAPGEACSATQILLEKREDLMSDLKRFSDPMWNFNLDRIPSERQEEIHEIDVLGVDRLSPGVTALSTYYPRVGIVETGAPDQVVRLRIRAGVPLFALTCVGDLWHYYSRAHGLRTREKFHADGRWASWPEIMDHYFAPQVLDLMARGIASDALQYSASSVDFVDQSGSRSSLGQDLLSAYSEIARDDSLQQELRSRAGTTQADSVRAAEMGDKLWGLLGDDNVRLSDRPIIEALVQRLDRIKRRRSAAASA